MSEGKRWEAEAERVRKRAPEWIDVARLPWWVLLLIGVGWILWGAYRLMTGDSLYDRIGGAVIMLLPSAGLIVGALRLRRGEPLYSQGRSRRRLG